MLKSKSENSILKKRNEILHHEVEKMETLIEKIIEEKGETLIRYSVADIMGQGCVNCHNSHPLSSKNDWKVGDFRGVVSVTLPVTSLQNSIIHQFTILQSVLVLILLIMITSLISIAKRIVKDVKKLLKKNVK